MLLQFFAAFLIGWCSHELYIQTKTEKAKKLERKRKRS